MIIVSFSPNSEIENHGQNPAKLPGPSACCETKLPASSAEATVDSVPSMVAALGEFRAAWSQNGIMFSHMHMSTVKSGSQGATFGGRSHTGYARWTSCTTSHPSMSSYVTCGESQLLQAAGRELEGTGCLPCSCHSWSVGDSAGQRQFSHVQQWH